MQSISQINCYRDFSQQKTRRSVNWILFLENYELISATTIHFTLDFLFALNDRFLAAGVFKILYGYICCTTRTFTWTKLSAIQCNIVQGAIASTHNCIFENLLINVWKATKKNKIQCKHNYCSDVFLWGGFFILFYKISLNNLCETLSC